MPLRFWELLMSRFYDRTAQGKAFVLPTKRFSLVVLTTMNELCAAASSRALQVVVEYFLTVKDER